MTRSWVIGFIWYVMTFLLSSAVGTLMSQGAWSSTAFLLALVIPQALLGMAIGSFVRGIERKPLLVAWLTYIVLAVVERTVFRTYIVYDWGLVTLITMGGDLVLASLGLVVGVMIPSTRNAQGSH